MTGAEHVQLLAELFGRRLAEDAQLLAQLLRLPRPGPIEHSGATRLFEDIAGCGLLAEVRTRILRPLTPDERRLLEITWDETNVAHRRGSLLRTETGVPVLDAEAILLPQRVPDDETRKRIGMSDDGSPLEGSPPREPLGRALRGHGVIREPLTVELTPGRFGPTGEPQIICSRALVRGNSGPIGLINELINKAFIDKFHDSLQSMGRLLIPSPAGEAASSAQNGRSAMRVIDLAERRISRGLHEMCGNAWRFQCQHLREYAE